MPKKELVSKPARSFQEQEFLEKQKARQKKLWDDHLARVEWEKIPEDIMVLADQNNVLVEKMVGRSAYVVDKTIRTCHINPNCGALPMFHSFEEVRKYLKKLSSGKVKAAFRVNCS
ncbi:MAG: hypothetical protein AAF530_07295 [Pseudomonadota bacterium]